MELEDDTTVEEYEIVINNDIVDVDNSTEEYTEEVTVEIPINQTSVTTSTATATRTADGG